jgi:predicted nucleotide-binding protein (sugar kinase/HSP70/actin superfamily)
MDLSVNFDVYSFFIMKDLFYDVTVSVMNLTTTEKESKTLEKDMANKLKKKMDELLVEFKKKFRKLHDPLNISNSLGRLQD